MSQGIKNKSVPKREHLSVKIYESINEYVKQHNENPVSVGNKFCEWVLNNIFDLREDELIEASEIGGQFDNGIDAVFQTESGLFILQCKFGSSHSLDGMLKFKEDCERILVETPITNRQIVSEKCKDIRQQFENGENIFCYYITNEEFSQLEAIRIRGLRKIFPNVNIDFLDIEAMTETIAEKNGTLPKGMRDKKIKLYIEKHFESENTVVAMVKLNNFANFIGDGGNLLFHSNIRNFLNNTDINKGIKKTLENEPDKFWFYNNGITIVCDEYERGNRIVTVTSPQIVNGCQTAKSIERFYNTKTRKEASTLDIEGNVLVKIIRPKTSETEENRKKIRDNITRYTNSQNAVKGLDFYSLDEFQRGLQSRFEKIGYYYEIQRGAFITLDKSTQVKYRGLEYYQYLVPNNFKFTLPAKEVIQAYTAGIKQMPNVAYGKPKELTPIGDKWGEICNEETKNLDAEFFLFPYLIFIYSKSFMGYGNPVKKAKNTNDFRRACSLLYVSTYYMILMELVKMVQNVQIEKPEEISIKTYRTIFSLSELNTKLLNLADKILDDYFSDSKIEEEVADDLKNFLKVKVIKKDNWLILERKVKRGINNYIDLFTDILK